MLNAASIILGFTGSIGSGCTYIAEAIPKNADKKYSYYKISSVIRDSLIQKGIPEPTIEDLQNEGNSIRKTNGNGYLIVKLLEQITEEKDIDNVIIDGIKHTEEVEILRQFPHFFLFSIQSLQAEREKRCLAQKNISQKEFTTADKRDQFEEELEYGQQVKKCNYLSDIIILNNENIASSNLHRKKDFINRIIRSYIEPIQSLVDGSLSHNISPSFHELYMTIAYTLSKKSSCLKRKVGAVIIEDEDIDDLNKESDERILSFPHIVSSGYNEVPVGSHKCAFHPEIQKCHRDFLQENYARRLKFCPSCGESISAQFVCHRCNKRFNEYVKSCTSCLREIETKAVCPKCGIDVYKEFIPGEKVSTGKLLDMCRALHAEEMALLKLSKYNMKSQRNLVLYTTTQPCNLCANKIVSAGIKKVVFTEPYPMKEATDTLEKGGVELVPFQGIKSSAYFKLYQ